MAIKILNVVWDNRMGGVQRRVVLAAKELREHNLETILVAPREEGYFSQLAAEEGLKVYQVTLKRPHHFDKPSSILFNLLWFLVFPFSVFIIARIINREHISILHTNGLLNLQAPVAALLMRRKIVWHLVGSIYPRPLLRLLMPFIRLVSDRIVLIAEKMSPYYLGKADSSLVEKVTVIHDPVNTERFNPNNIPAEVKHELKAQFHVNPGDRLIGCVGNINPAKGYEYLLQCASLVQKRYDKVRFIIVGMKLETQRAYYRSLKALVSSLALEEHVTFAGERHDIPQILSP